VKKMAKKPRKTRTKLAKFEDWELRFMREGPPSLEVQKTSGHGFAYLSGHHIWRRLQREPGFDPKDYPWGRWAFRNVQV
jgi:hypothetical protein